MRWDERKLRETILQCYYIQAMSSAARWNEKETKWKDINLDPSTLYLLYSILLFVLTNHDPSASIKVGQWEMLSFTSILRLYIYYWHANQRKANQLQIDTHTLFWILTKQKSLKILFSVWECRGFRGSCCHLSPLLSLSLSLSLFISLNVKLFARKRISNINSR